MALKQICITKLAKLINNDRIKIIPFLNTLFFFFSFSKANRNIAAFIYQKHYKYIHCDNTRFKRIKKKKSFSFNRNILLFLSHMKFDCVYEVNRDECINTLYSLSRSECVNNSLTEKPTMTRETSKTILKTTSVSL